MLFQLTSLRPKRQDQQSQHLLLENQAHQPIQGLQQLTEFLLHPSFVCCKVYTESGALPRRLHAVIEVSDAVVGQEASSSRILLQMCPPEQFANLVFSACGMTEGQIPAAEADTVIIVLEVETLLAETALHKFEG